jgi:hypothetical protein
MSVDGVGMPPTVVGTDRAGVLVIDADVCTADSEALDVANK